MNSINTEKNSKEEKKIKIRNNSYNSILNKLNNNSTNSLLSTTKDSNYYMRESELLSKYIKDYQDKNKEYPKTDLSFYKFGRIIGKGDFGKVNLDLNVLIGRIISIKSFNKDIKNELYEKKYYMKLI